MCPLFNSIHQCILHLSWPHPLNQVCTCLWVAAAISFIELLVQLLFKGGYYSGCGFIQINMVFMLYGITITSLASAWLTTQFTTWKAMSLLQAMHALGIRWFSVYIISACHYLHCYYCYAATFTETPSSQVVAVGQEAVFICRSSTATAFGWIWNGSEVINLDPPPGITPDDNILTIVALSDYNVTEIVCVAFSVSEGSVRTPPVRLLIQGTESAPIDIHVRHYVRHYHWLISVNLCITLH